MNRGSIPWKRKKLCVHEIDRAGCRVHATSYSMGTGDTFAGVKRPEREANQSAPFIPSLRMNGTIAPFLRMLLWLAQRPRLPCHWLFKLSVIWTVPEDCCGLGYCALDSGRNIAIFRLILLRASWRLITQRRYTSSTLLVEASDLSEKSVLSYQTAQCNYRTATFLFTTMKTPSLTHIARVLKTITVYLCCITKVTVRSVFILKIHVMSVAQTICLKMLKAMVLSSRHFIHDTVNGRCTQD